MLVKLIPLLVFVIIFLELGLLLYEMLMCEQFITPTYIYNNTKLNRPTCWVLFILFLLTAWLNNLFKICSVTVYFFHWITHVGRNDENEE